jgi:hypothetical protein
VILHYRSSTAAQHSLGVSSPLLRLELSHCVTTTTLSENVESGSYRYSYQTTKGVARRRMTLSPSSSTAPASRRQINFASFTHTSNIEFTFRIPPHPTMALTFPQRPSVPRSKKRCRAAADIDGEHSCTWKKKRRLRLFLITSRLSPQFSHPATNIVDRGNSKIAVWAKQKAMGRNLLRKAAILNRIRRQSVCERGARVRMGRALVEQEKEQEHLRLAKLAFDNGSTDTYTRPLHLRDGSDTSSSPPSRSPSGSPSPPLRALDAKSSSEYRSPNDAYSYSPPLRAQSPRRSHIPLPRSPLGISNYDAFDMEDDLSDPYSQLDDGFELGDEEADSREDTPFNFPAAPATRPPITSRGSSENTLSPPPVVYSDFGMLDPDEPVFGDYDQVEEGADAIWPAAFVPDASPDLPLSSSPDFPTLFVTTHTNTTASSPNFTPSLPASVPPETHPVSPNFPPTSSSTTSPNFPSTSTVPMSPNFPSTSTAALSPTASSPNFGPLSTTTIPDESITDDTGFAVSRAYPPRTIRRESASEAEEERQRQRRYMFMHFGS